MSGTDAKGNEHTDQAPAQQEPGTPEEPTCANCGHPIEPDDIECPNCGISLVAG